LHADAQGHFFTTGTINGVSVRFLVDTGASMISLGASDARRMGLDFNRGQKGISQTANGQVVVSKVQVDNVRIGGMTLHQVDVVIHQSDLPIALLGMSVLNRMEMQREGSTMTLKKRF
jgi:aspartyl protease family protein